jgi:hypothetical protein
VDLSLLLWWLWILVLGSFVPFADLGNWVSIRIHRMHRTREQGGFNGVGCRELQIGELALNLVELHGGGLHCEARDESGLTEGGGVDV